MDENTPQRALSKWHPLEGPEIKYAPQSKLDGTLPHELFHELFHLASPIGGGLCVDGHAREIVAHRFTVEMTTPLPGMIHLAQTDAAPLICGSMNCEEVMRTTSRKMFLMRIPASGDFGQAVIVVQQRENLPQIWLPEYDYGMATWDELVLWSKRGLVDYNPAYTHWGPAYLRYEGSVGTLNIQTVDGLYYVVEAPEGIWSQLTDMGVVEFQEFAKLESDEVTLVSAYIPDVTLDDGSILGSVDISLLRVIPGK